MTRIRSVLLAASAALLLSASAALAHPKVVSSDPPADGHVTGSPKAIRIEFSEAFMPKFTGVVLKDAKGRVIPTGKAAADPQKKTVLVVPLKGALAPGDYVVEWHAVGDDTHRVGGRFGFMVM
jgi:hypothetical protein